MSFIACYPFLAAYLRACLRACACAHTFPFFPFKYSRFFSLIPSHGKNLIRYPPSIHSPLLRSDSSDHQVKKRLPSCAMVQWKWAGKTKRLQKRHCGPNALLCQIYKFPAPSRRKSDLHNYKPERKKNTNGPILLHSTHSFSLLLPFSPSFSLISPPLVYLYPFSDNGLVSYHPSFRWGKWCVWRIVVFFSFSSIHVWLPAFMCAFWACGCMVSIAKMVWSTKGALVRWSSQPATR